MKKIKNFSPIKINPKKFTMAQVPFLMMVAPVAVFMLMPLLYIFNHAFKPFDELIEYPPKFFVRRPTLENLFELFETATTTGIPVSRYLFNSIVITALVVFLSIFLSTITGYALSKLKFHIKGAISQINTLAMMFVGTAVIIPRYIIIEQMGLVDNFLVHIVPVIAIPVGLFLVKQFIDQIPNELLDAAKIDGANSFQIYWKIVLPLIKPAIATIAILSFQAVWNNADISATYINSDSLKTFAYYMQTLSSSSNVVAGAGMSAVASLIMFLPNLIIFIILQNKVMNTMVHSGIK
ncbi:MAG: ABC transporter permease [Tenericutes bacterium GWC2_39_45]|jgi:ABC-type glycerol-3-phosphate transport system permease component|nr:MAG: ABC transporter permease [Tenericutes bacterium GWA2_38_26]OHE30716.1 MAG: ABC transporter permease [Tenericutes bacterium GWC2_39_45]OHE31516.1 MAG: ABC transporter permease [Tenericutes bacterium GWD2_38_27]OHE36644.1 MAG: ABC transporter permease [Tenericutes bacterium GWE2_38_8]OHE41956.1 MAG: ABC transporter permease [Tenericutes bacterium GWF2_38_8]HBG33339.1 ABC transporter permease [Acholeplasmataceae bacterium]